MVVVFACAASLSYARLVRSVRIANSSRSPSRHRGLSMRAPCYFQPIQPTWRAFGEQSQPLLSEAQSLAFYPTPYSVSPSFAMLRTPWFLDYGHLTFWFFFFSTFVIIIWIVYMFVGITQNVEQRRPVRETRGFSRAQTGDTLTAVLPLTWSVTMLAHAGTHSSNFDENTTATAFSFTVIAYQWGWNYYFPREIAELLVAAPKLVGHGHVATLRATDAYSALLAQTRLEHHARLVGSTRYTAKHGRRVVSNTLSILLPTSAALPQLPDWAVSGVSSAVAVAGAGDAPLLAQAAVAANTRGWLWATHAASWQTASRLPAWGVDAGAAGAGLRQLTTAGTFDLPVTGRAPGLWATTQTTQNAAMAANLVWVGNRLQLIHQQLTCGSVVDAAPSHAAAAATLRRLVAATARGAGVQPTERGPVGFANALSIPVTPVVETGALSWVRALASMPLGSFSASAVFSEQPLMAQPWLSRVSAVLTPETAAPLLWGQATTDYSFVGARGASSALRERLRQVCGAPLTALGGNSAELGESDSGVNQPGSAAEWAAASLAQRAEAPAYALSSLRDVLPHVATLRCAALLQPRAVAQGSASREALALGVLSSNPAASRTGWALSATAGRPVTAPSSLGETRAAGCSQLAVAPQRLALWHTPYVSLAGERRESVSFSTEVPQRRAVATSQGAPAYATALASGLSPWASFGNVVALNMRALSAVAVLLDRLQLLDAAGVASATPDLALGFQLLMIGDRLSGGFFDAVLLRPVTFGVSLVTGTLLPNHAGWSATSRVQHVVPLLAVTAPSTASQLTSSGLPASVNALVLRGSSTAACEGWLLAETAPVSAPRVVWFSRDLGVTAGLPHASTLSTSVEGLSDYQPTRVAASEAGEPLAPNTRGQTVRANANLATAAGRLQTWRQLWSWQTAVAGLPWDQLFYSQFARRPLSGVGRSQVEQAWANQAALTAMQRLRFDKTTQPAYLPEVVNTKQAPVLPELALAVLDTERGGLAGAYVVALPQPNVDLDASFLFTRWAAEVNTSRRSDHDARYRVSWGPLAAALGSGSTAQSQPWSRVSGPAALAGAPVSLKQLFSLTLNSGESAPVADLTASGLPAFLELWQQRPQATLRTGAPLRALASSLTSLRGARVSVIHPVVTGLQGSHGFGPNAAPTAHNAAALPAVSTLAVWGLACQSVVSAPLTTTAHFGESLALTPVLPSCLGVIAWAAGLTQGAAHAMAATSACEVSVDQLRNGYTGIQADVGSMRRLRVTKGVYLPSDTPMHGIFGSKDVIHSWAIPGLGVKIDCIPGYSSHRRLLLRWRGLFWGQCMEVCGRYHHWMPILVRVVHRDVFLSWCLTYIRLLAPRAQASVAINELVVAREVWAIAVQVQ